MFNKHDLATEEFTDGTRGKDPREMTEYDLKKLGHVKKPLSKVIKAMCNSCVGADPCGQRHPEVRNCQSIGCPIWAYRLGNPFSTRGAMSEEKKQEFAERMRRVRDGG